VATNPYIGPIRLPCHFGEWLQGRIGEAGPLALITLMPHGVSVWAKGEPAPRPICRAVTHGAMDPQLLTRFATGLGQPLNTRITLRLPYPPGLGTGMSTAGLLALAHLSGRFTPDDLAQACVEAEGASDPLMHPHPDRLLWASRQGRILAHLPAVPRAHLLTGFYGPARPTNRSDQDYDDISDLIPHWRSTTTLADKAALATQSASRCLARRGPANDPTPQLTRDLGALGWAMSHSGAARALIFAPGTLPAHGVAALREAGLRGVGVLATGTA
jgi:uncharacterized protein involved in propanediol utilization